MLTKIGLEVEVRLDGLSVLDDEWLDITYTSCAFRAML